MSQDESKWHAARGSFMLVPSDKVNEAAICAYCKHCGTHGILPSFEVGAIECRASPKGIHPVSGYVLYKRCLEVNPDGSCLLFEGEAMDTPV